MELALPNFGYMMLGSPSSSGLKIMGEAYSFVVFQGMKAVSDGCFGISRTDEASD